jgi:predicted TIM-barrel fold metal-dependent hydrolase
MDGIIDAHAHVWTERSVRYPRAAGEPDYPPERFTPQDFLVHAQLNGVTRAVLVQMSFYGFDHSYMLDAMGEHPGIFSGVGAVDISVAYPDAAMKELASRGVRGFRIVPGSSPQAVLDTEGMRAIWRCGAEQQLAICPLINPDALPVIDQMCTRFPDTPVVIDHLARISIDGAPREGDIRLLCSLAKHSHVYVKVSAFYALGRKRAPYTDLVPLIRRVFEEYGPRRLMWGSDCPFQVGNGHLYGDSVELVRERLDFVSEQDRAWLLSKTAASLFFTP